MNVTGRQPERVERDDARARSRSRSRRSRRRRRTARPCRGRGAAPARADAAQPSVGDYTAGARPVPPARIRSRPMSELIHTCYRITDIDRSVAFYEKLGFEELRRMPISRRRDQRLHGPARRRRPARADLQPRRRRAVRDRHRLRPHRDHRRRPRRNARAPRRAGHRAREAALHRARGRLAPLLRPRPGRTTGSRYSRSSRTEDNMAGEGIKRGFVAAAGAVGVAALVWAAIAIADEIDCGGGGKQCNGTQFDDTDHGVVEGRRHQRQGRQRRDLRRKGERRRRGRRGQRLRRRRKGRRQDLRRRRH